MNNTTYIATTIKEIISTTKEIATTIPETKKDEGTNVILLGFSQFKLFIAYFTFYIYLTPTKNILYTNQILFPMIITYNRNIRRLLKESRANCTLDLVESDVKFKYYCHVNEETANIKEVKLIPDFDFVSQDNVTLIGITPLSKMFMNNMILLTEENIYNNILEDSFVYILNNSEFKKYDRFMFNISGEINDPQPKLENKNLILTINLENNDKLETTNQCNISNKTRTNYILNCKANEAFIGEIQSAISFIDGNDILLVNFADINDSIIDIEEEENQSQRLYAKSRSNGLGAGAIVGIIVPLVVVIALVTFLIFHFKIKNKEVILSSESSAYNIKPADDTRN